MGIINVLSFDVANLIAAGEVVDRPGSVIKELVENSIDAGASRITVEIQHGGVSFMRVTDNGKGMAPEDLPIAIRRHATSKIKDAGDLDAIITLGFRGEALAAICSVSDVRIISKQKESLMGSAIEVHSGRPGTVTEQGAADGTTVIVENLFANVPARLKFLKRDLTEASYVGTLVEKIAMSHPEVAFKFIVDGTMKLNTSGDGSLQGVIRAIFGREFAAKLLNADADLGGVRVTGYITAPDVPRANRNYQNFFINGRYVKSKTAAAAVEQAYKSYIPPEKFPGCILKLEIAPSAVDVNVHPSKLEVKFSDERPVFDAVYRAVRDALLSNTLRPGGESPVLQPKKPTLPLGNAFVPVNDRADRGAEPDIVQLGIKDAPVAPAKSVSAPKPSPLPADDRPGYRSPVTGLGAFGGNWGTAVSGYTVDKKSTQTAVSRVSVQESAPESSQESSQESVQAGAAESEQAGTQTVPAVNNLKSGISGGANPCGPDKPEIEAPVAEKPVFKNYRIAGEVFNSYILVEEDDRLTVIDKHAAHERLNFEKMRRSLKGADHPVSFLAVPADVTVSSEECAALEENREQLSKLGFEFTAGHGCIRVMGIPMELRTEDALSLFEDFADALVSGSGNVELIGDTAFEKALYQASCKASIKAGRVYPPDYAEKLVDELMKHPEITYCPHGRPVAFTFSKNDIDHRFKRN